VKNVRVHIENQKPDWTQTQKQNKTNYPVSVRKRRGRFLQQRPSH